MQSESNLDINLIKSTYISADIKSFSYSELNHDEISSQFGLPKSGVKSLGEFGFNLDLFIQF